MSILASKKAGIEYVEHCAIRAADERLVYVRKKEAYEQHFSIPSLNTAVLLLGPGTSLTQQAARLCSEGNILVGFCGGGGTPIYFASLNEYREPAYCKAWISIFNDELLRIEAAKSFQHQRIAMIRQCWKNNPAIGFAPDEALTKYETTIPKISNGESLLLLEAECSKKLYAQLARHFNVSFKRETRGVDMFNAYLDSGNYMAYGLAACTLWTLGIPHSYPVMHGKTRRGALVFDVADIVKDAIVMPNAFISAHLKEPENLARRRILAAFHEHKVLNTLFVAVKNECAKNDKNVETLEEI